MKAKFVEILKPMISCHNDAVCSPSAAFEIESWGFVGCTFHLQAKVKCSLIVYLWSFNAVFGCEATWAGHTGVGFSHRSALLRQSLRMTNDMPVW